MQNGACFGFCPVSPLCKFCAQLLRALLSLHWCKQLTFKGVLCWNPGENKKQICFILIFLLFNALLLAFALYVYKQVFSSLKKTDQKHLHKLEACLIIILEPLA